MASESVTAKTARAGTIVARLKKEFPRRETALEHGSPLQLLIATILSAQCTDERVNKVTGPLFEKYRTAADFARADRSALEMEIRSTGFFRAKTNSILKCTQMLVEKHRGEVPKTMEELTQLAGVGRKTANVVLGNYFGIASGVVVDTHVKRLSGLLGLTKQTDPEKVEADLMKLIPKKDWIAIGNLLILHGRKTCNARKPRCEECKLSDICPSVAITAAGHDSPNSPLPRFSSIRPKSLPTSRKLQQR